MLAKFAGAMGNMLDVRSRARVPILLAGIMLARGRRTASSWFRAAGVKDDWDRFYDLLGTMGKQSESLMLPLLRWIVERLDPGPNMRLELAIDDSPSKRYGRHVEAANIHHNPTPGPGDGQWLYGHSWVCLAMVLSHSLYGAIALPLLSHLYVREEDIPAIQARYGWEFRTKHQLALDLCTRVMRPLRALGLQAGFTVVFDGAYAVKTLIRPLMKEGAIVVTRLRSDANLHDLPVAKRPQRGRPPIYGRNKIALKRIAARRDAWADITFSRRGVTAQGQYKTFLATSRVFGGTIRVVLVRYDDSNWAAYASSDPSMTPEEILRVVADRWSIEEHFHDVKEVWGAGQQQVRRLDSNVACWNLCGWQYTMVELACWDTPAEQLVDRSERPWDNPDRRPSHADRKRYLTRKMLDETFMKVLPSDPNSQKIRNLVAQLIALAT